MDGTPRALRSLQEKREAAETVLARLDSIHPENRPALDHSNPFELLVATVLSAQCTDAMVNRVTPSLFSRFPDPAALALSSREELESLIHSAGFFRAKASNIAALSRLIRERHGGEVPRTMEELVALPGVGRKTAGVVLSACFGQPAIIVDTHFGRVARRLAFTLNEDPLKIEKDIASFLPPERWTRFSHVLNRHGRNPCISRAPRCGDCPLNDMCPSAFGK